LGLPGQILFEIRSEMELGRKHCIQCERQEGANHLMRAMRLPATNERLSTITTFIMVASIVVPSAADIVG